jgi:hypothetical protein
MNIQMYELHGISICDNKQVSFHNQKTKIFQKFFMLHINFLKGSFAAKKLEIEFLNKFAFFFVGCFSFFPINKESISFSKKLTIWTWTTSTCFFQNFIPSVL